MNALLAVRSVSVQTLIATQIVRLPFGGFLVGTLSWLSSLLSSACKWLVTVSEF
jgi:hypothetical protein